MKAVRHFPVMAGCKLSEADAAKLHALAAQTGLPKGVVLRELVKRARVEEWRPPERLDPEEATPTRT
jgi:hypothetical protein